MNELRDYLENSCIRALEKAILEDEPFSLKYNDLMEIYTFIYNRCIRDKERVQCRFFYEYYQQLLHQFLIKVNHHKTGSHILLQQVTHNYQKYHFYVKNLSIMFRVLNKHYLYKHQYDDLEEMSLTIWNQSYMSEIQGALFSYMSQDYINEKTFQVDQLYKGLLDMLIDTRSNQIDAYIFRYLSSLEIYYQRLNIPFESIEHFCKVFETVKAHERNVLEKITFVHDLDVILHQRLLHSFHNQYYLTIASQTIQSFIQQESDAFLIHYSSWYTIHKDMILSLWRTLLKTCVQKDPVHELFILYQKMDRIKDSNSLKEILVDYLNEWIENHRMHEFILQMYKKPMYIEWVKHVRAQGFFLDVLVEFIYQKCFFLQLQYC